MSGKSRLTLSVITFKRPDSLTPLLPRLIEQGEDAEIKHGIEFVVSIVDNDPLGSAREAVEAVEDDRIRYVVEPEPGVSSARNRALAEAADCDYLVFIDDDEIPHPGWLVSLFNTMKKFGVDAVAGPVRTVSEGPLDSWRAASGAHLRVHRAHLRTGDMITRAATNNLLLRLATVRRLGVTFDERFGLTGGEDSFFTGQLDKQGARMVWCAEALVDDVLAPSRNSREYNLQRRFSLSNAGGRVDVLLEDGHRRFLARGKNIARGAAPMGLGASMVIRSRFGDSLKMRSQGERYIMGGMGVLAAGLGIAATPYRRKKGSIE